MAERFVGIRSIDGQHQELEVLAGKLLEIARRPGPGSRLLPFVEELHRTVREHFHVEEALMRKHKFPGLTTHKECHETYLSTLLRVKSDLARLGDQPANAERIDSQVVQWLALHTDGYDCSMAKFLREKGEA